MKITHKNAPFDHYEAQPEVRFSSGVALGIAIGVLVVLAAIAIGVIYV